MLEEKLCLEHKVIINIARPNDLPVIFSFCDEYNDGMNIDRTKAKNAIRDLVYIDGAMLAEYKGQTIGGIAGLVLPCMFTNDIIFSVMFFYVKPEFRFLTSHIVKEVELVLLPTKVTKIVFGVPVFENKKPEELVRYYRMQGYKPLEVHLFKRLVDGKTS